MKKFTKIFIVALVLIATCCAIVACDGGGESQAKTYNITCVSGDNYTVTSNPEKAKEGERVVITVTADEFYEVESVKANETVCEKNLAGQYELIMPAKDVTVTAVVKAQPDVSEDDGMYFVKAYAQLAEGRQEDYDFNTIQTFEVSFGSEWVTNSTNEQGLLYATVRSTNQEVIPDDAFSKVTATEVIYGSRVKGAEFSIDLKKIKKGTTKLVFEDTEHKRTLVKTIEVVGYGEVYIENLYTEKVIVDLSELEGEYDNLRIWITDQNYVYGSEYEKSQIGDFKFADGNYEFTFKYTPDHNFTIAIGYEYYNEDYQDMRFANFAIDEIILGGSTSTGMTGIYNGSQISFRADGETITAVVHEQ